MSDQCKIGATYVSSGVIELLMQLFKKEGAAEACAKKLGASIKVELVSQNDYAEDHTDIVFYKKIIGGTKFKRLPYFLESSGKTGAAQRKPT